MKPIFKNVIFFILGILTVIPILAFATPNLADRLSGRILLQVESAGEAWYVDPVDSKRYFMGSPTDAFKLMRDKGLGITNADLETIPMGDLTPLMAKIPVPPPPPPEDKSIKPQPLTINDIMSGVGNIRCVSDYGSSEGSGFLYNMNDTHYVLTNYHVIDILGVKYCFINLQDNNEFFIGSYKLVLDPAYNFNSSSDSAFLEIGEWFLKSLDKSEFPKIPDLNYNASELKHCGTKMSIGTKVYTIGYPAFAKQTVDVFGEEGDIEARTLTQGTITGYDKASQIPFGNLPEVDYFVSAEIDSGNSGGLAVAETNRGLCLLGIPTWVVIGDFENQGVVQNIHNIFYED